MREVFPNFLTLSTVISWRCRICSRRDNNAVAKKKSTSTELSQNIIFPSIPLSVKVRRPYTAKKTWGIGTHLTMDLRQIYLWLFENLGKTTIVGGHCKAGES